MNENSNSQRHFILQQFIVSSPVIQFLICCSKSTI